MGLAFTYDSGSTADFDTVVATESFQGLLTSRQPDGGCLEMAVVMAFASEFKQHTNSRNQRKKRKKKKANAKMRERGREGERERGRESSVPFYMTAGKRL
ncbi:hypothetical protein J3458_020073 [Metarhizium acridum]|uniref:uncharacterized protein n=1 Tax=Metarhizium acridum TaxID=92637 RepID=UPI001C6B994C|nr:hypothetical protein J3458_020073 [Metarhizium acridum]